MSPDQISANTLYATIASSLAAILSCAATLALTLLTRSYVRLTRELVLEAKASREALSEPKLLVTITPRDDCVSWIDIIVTNIGNGHAHDVRFQVRPDLSMGHKDRDGKEIMLSDVGFIARGLPVFAPGQTLRFFLTSLFEDFDAKMNQPISISVTYQTGIGKPCAETFVLDFAVFRHMSQLGSPPMVTIADSLEKMQKDIHNLATGWSSISVKRDRRERYRRLLPNTELSRSVEEGTSNGSSFSDGS